MSRHYKWRDEIEKQERTYDNRQSLVLLFRSRSNTLNINDINRFKRRVSYDEREDLSHFMQWCPAYEHSRKKSLALQQPYEEVEGKVIGRNCYTSPSLRAGALSTHTQVVNFRTARWVPVTHNAQPSTAGEKHSRVGRGSQGNTFAISYFTDTFFTSTLVNRAHNNLLRHTEAQQTLARHTKSSDTSAHHQRDNQNPLPTTPDHYY